MSAANANNDNNAKKMHNTADTLDVNKMSSHVEVQEGITKVKERKTTRWDKGNSILSQLMINPSKDRNFRPIELDDVKDEEGNVLQIVERPIDIDEINQRQLEIHEIESDIAELSEIMKDLNNEVVVQFDLLDDIEDKMVTIEEKVEKAVAELQAAAKLRARRRRMKFSAWGVGLGGTIGCVAGAGGGIALGSATVVGVPVGGIAGGAGGFMLGSVLGGALGTGLAVAIEAGQDKAFTRKAVNMHKKEFLRKASRSGTQHCMLCNTALKHLGLKWARGCSVCGGLFCWKCSNNKVQIKYAGLDKLVTERVCSRCNQKALTN